jgi:thiamine biosynthesis protein ThiI
MMKAVVLLSGGIDSPVAAFMMGSLGVDIALLHMDNRPHGDDSGIKKAELLSGALEAALGKRLDLFVSPHGRNQTLIAEKAKRSFQCVLCKKLMLGTAQAVAINIGAEAIITGESLGQVASQTLPNMRVEQAGISIPILRPLIGLDKIEIEARAKKIGTYEISIIRGSGCTIVPDRPMTMTSPDQMKAEVEKLDIDEMVAYAAANARFDQNRGQLS